MQALLPWLSILVVIVAGWMLIKRVQTHMTLLFAGLIMILAQLRAAYTAFCPRASKLRVLCSSISSTF